MIGSRPLTNEEIAAVSKRLSTRDRMFFIIGIKTGFRVSEILSLKVSDVILPDGGITNTLSVQRKNMKGQNRGRTVVLHLVAREMIDTWRKQFPLGVNINAHLFESNRGRPMSRMQAWRVLNKAYKSARLQGKLGTHAMRKTFANRVYARLKNDLVRTQKALGHVSIASTISYLSFEESDVDDAILGG